MSIFSSDKIPPCLHAQQCHVWYQTIKVDLGAILKRRNKLELVFMTRFLVPEVVSTPLKKCVIFDRKFPNRFDLYFKYQSISRFFKLKCPVIGQYWLNVSSHYRRVLSPPTTTEYSPLVYSISRRESSLVSCFFFFF